MFILAITSINAPYVRQLLEYHCLCLVDRSPVLFIFVCCACFFNHADNSRSSKAFSGVCLFVILSVCLHNNSKKNDPNQSVQTLYITYILSPWDILLQVVWFFLAQKSRSQGHKVQKDDQVVHVSLHLYRVPSL